MRVPSARYDGVPLPIIVNPGGDLDFQLADVHGINDLLINILHGHIKLYKEVQYPRMSVAYECGGHWAASMVDNGSRRLANGSIGIPLRYRHQ